jgi:hypothetical protein
MMGAGLHTYEWKYEKNAPAGEDDDCVWIDWIEFPLESPPMNVNAGPDDSSCSENDYQLNGEAQNFVSIEWSTTGDGSFDNPAILAPVYTPGAEDMINGSVTLSITVMNENDDEENDDMILTIVPKPEITTGSEAIICSGENFIAVDATAKNCESLLWTTAGDGVFDDNTILAATYIPGPQDIANGFVVLSMNAFAFPPCEDITENLILSIDTAPGIPETPQGPDYVDVFQTPTSEYTTNGSSDAESYIWDISPAEAGIISGESTTGLVEWNSEYTGEAEIFVKGINDCGQSDWSEGFTVNVFNTVGLADGLEKGNINIIPNPSNGEFRLESTIIHDLAVNIRIMDVIGNMVYEESEVMLNNGLNKKFDLTGFQKGLYVMFIESKETSVTKKFVIQ